MTHTLASYVISSRARGFSQKNVFSGKPARVENFEVLLGPLAYSQILDLALVSDGLVSGTKKKVL